LKFLIDMPLSPALAAWLSQQGHDAVHAASLGLDTASDTDIIVRARGEGRIIITADLDYPRLLALARADEPSLILFRGGDWSEREVRDRLASILHAISAADIVQSILTIDRNRVRRRRLPITC
jgi:predicted nuclease of predicted toxin-antitoxin system